jgi:hypothetical protein
VCLCVSHAPWPRCGKVLAQGLPNCQGEPLLGDRYHSWAGSGLLPGPWSICSCTRCSDPIFLEPSLRTWHRACSASLQIPSSKWSFLIPPWKTAQGRDECQVVLFPKDYLAVWSSFPLSDSTACMGDRPPLLWDGAVAWLCTSNPHCLGCMAYAWSPSSQSLLTCTRLCLLQLKISAFKIQNLFLFLILLAMHICLFF